ncbi:MAG: hypothetical protein U0939_14790 [Pirellulales bacterium]
MSRDRRQSNVRKARELWERNHAVVVNIAQQWLAVWFPAENLKVDRTIFSASEEDWTAFNERKRELVRQLRGPELWPHFRRLAARRDWSELASEAMPWNLGGPLSSTNELCGLLNGHKRLQAQGKLTLEAAIKTIVTPLRENARCWRGLFARAERTAPQRETRNTRRVSVKRKRSTQKGDARAKLLAALLLHHGYMRDTELVLEPIGNNELARAADVARSSASAFIKDAFGGRTEYRRVCKGRTTLLARLKHLDGGYVSRRHLQEQQFMDRDDSKE